MERAIVAFEGEKTAGRICEILEGERIAVCYPATNGAAVRRMAARLRSATVVCGYKLQGESAQRIFYDLPRGTPMIVIARQDMLSRIDADIVPLPAPLTPKQLCDAVLAAAAAHSGRRQRSEASRAAVEQAKQLLMTHRGMTEAEAHRYIQKTSMDSGRKTEQTAALILKQYETKSEERT